MDEKKKVKTYRDLLVWQKSMKLVTEIYRSLKSFPDDEIYGLISQMRRCAVSIPSNIAEGFGRDSNSEFRRFLSIAASSLYELQTQIEISRNLEYLDQNSFEILFESTREIERMRSNKGSRNISVKKTRFPSVGLFEEYGCPKFPDFFGHVWSSIKNKQSASVSKLKKQ